MYNHPDLNATIYFLAVKRVYVNEIYMEQEGQGERERERERERQENSIVDITTYY